MIIISTETNKSLGKTIKEYRKKVAKKNLTEFAKMNKIDKETLRRIEASNDIFKREPTLKVSFYSNLDLTDFGIPTVETAKTVGERIEVYRIVTGNSRKSLSKKTHLSSETIRNIETGKYEPTKDKIRLIAEGLNLEPKMLDSAFDLDNWSLLDYITYFRKMRDISVKTLLDKIGIHPSRLQQMKEANATLTRNEFYAFSRLFDSEEFDNIINKKYLKTEVINLSYYRKNTGLTNAEIIERYRLKKRELAEYDKGTREPSLYYISVVCELNHLSIKSYITEITLSQIVKYYRDKNHLLKKELVKLLGTYPRALAEVEFGKTLGEKAYDSFYKKMDILLREDYEQTPTDPVYRFWFEQENKAG